MGDLYERSNRRSYDVRGSHRGQKDLLRVREVPRSRVSDDQPYMTRSRDKMDMKDLLKEIRTPKFMVDIIFQRVYI